MTCATYWNFEEVPARRVWLTVSDSDAHPEYWARGFVGERRKAVEVMYRGTTFYLDDEPRDGQDEPGWAKVTDGDGSPKYAHRSLYPEPGSVEVREEGEDT